jgi:hypothetical protein
VGRVFGRIRVGGKLGLRMHYAMCGFRHFGSPEPREFYRATLALNRSPAPLAADAGAADPPPAPEPGSSGPADSGSSTVHSS